MQMHCFAMTGATSPNCALEHIVDPALAAVAVLKFCMALSVVIADPVLSYSRP